MSIVRLAQALERGWEDICLVLWVVIESNIKLMTQSLGSNRPGQSQKPEPESSHEIRLFCSQWRLGYPILPIVPAHQHRKTLVLDLDETLVHSVAKVESQAPPPHFDFELCVHMKRHETCSYYVIKRPHVDYFLKMVCQWFRVVVFTASLERYASPLVDLLDPNRRISDRKFRDDCEAVTSRSGNRSSVYYVKKLENICPDLSQILIIDNSPLAYAHNIENALPIKSFAINTAEQNTIDLGDQELLDMLPFLHSLTSLADVRSLLSLRIANLNAQ